MNNIIFNQRLKLLLQYIEQNGTLQRTDQLLFSHLDPTIEKDCVITNWLYRSLFYHSDLLIQECQKYQTTYPIACQFILKKITPATDHLTFKRKIELLMAYIETHKIPTSKEDIRFCDISSSTTNQTNVGVFIQDQLSYDETKFWTECRKYQQTHQQAWQKLEKKLNRRTNSLNDQDRLKAIITNFSKTDFTTIHTSQQFADLDPNILDPTLVNNWFFRTLNCKQEWLQSELTSYQVTNPESYQQLQTIINDYLTQKTLKPLTLEQRVELLMFSLETKKITKLNPTIRFCDLHPQITDPALVSTWLSSNLFEHKEEIVTICNNYQTLYPNAHQWFQERIQKHEHRSNSNLTQETKMHLVMAYLEEHDIPIRTNPLQFNHLTSLCNVINLTTITDESKVGTWITKTLSFNTVWFLTEFSKYKTLYPKAYLKLQHRINCRKRRLTQQRLLLITQLTQMRNTLEQNSLEKVSSLTKTLKKG